jgi:hypothetical protein
LRGDIPQIDSFLVLGALTPETRQWLDIGSSWLSAAATLAAVIVALWLARQDRRQRLLVQASIVRFVRPGQKYADGIPSVNFTATNIGLPPIIVTSPCWRVGLFRRKVLYQIPPDAPQNTPLPKELAHGQQLQLRAEIEQFTSGLFYLLEEVRKHPCPSLALRSIRAGFATTVEKRFFGRPNWELQGMLQTQFKAHKRSMQRTARVIGE